MAKEFLLILLSTVLVNTFVLVQFLGLCQFMGVSRKVETSTGLAFATTFVLTLSSVLSYIVDTYVLSPLGLNYLNTIAFRGAPIALISAGLMSLAFMGFTGLIKG